MLKKFYGRLFSSDEPSSGRNGKSASSGESSASSSAATTPEARSQKAPKLLHSSNEPTRVSSVNVQLHEEDAGTCACWVSPDVLASGGRDKTVAFFNVAEQQVENRFQAHESAVTRCCYAPGLDRLFTAARDGAVRIWNGSIELRTVKGHSLAVTGLSASVCRSHLVTGSRDCCVKLWDVCTAQLLRTVTISQNVVTWLSWPTGRLADEPAQGAPFEADFLASRPSLSDNGSALIVQSSEDKLVRVWDSRTLQIAVQFPRASHIQTHADLHIAAQQCVSSAHGDADGRVPVTVWDLRTGRAFATLNGHRESVGWCSFLHDWPLDGVHVASVSNDGALRVWRTDLSSENPQCVAQAQLATGFQTGACGALLTHVDSTATAKQSHSGKSHPTYSMYISTLQGGLFRVRYRANGNAVTFF